MITMLRFTVRSSFRMFTRFHRDREDRRGRFRHYHRSLCACDEKRWLRSYGRYPIGNGYKEIFTNP